MKARTKIEKQVAASNEKLTVLSPKVITWAVRKVAGHVCFRTSAHKCTCGDCSRQFDYEGKGKSVQSPNQKIPDRKTKCVIKTHINIKQNVIFSAKLKPV